MLDGGPGDGISGGEWRSLVGEVGQDVSLDAGRNGVGGGGDEAVEERGVGGVGKGVAAGLDGVAGVEVAIGQGVLRVGRLAGDVLAAAGRGLEWVSDAAAVAAVDRVDGGGVKRTRAWCRPSLERTTLWRYWSSVTVVGPLTATSLSGPSLGRRKSRAASE